MLLVGNGKAGCPWGMDYKWGDASTDGSTDCSALVLQGITPGGNSVGFHSLAT